MGNDIIIISGTLTNPFYTINEFVSAANTPMGHATTPEPSTMLLLGTGLAGLAFWRWRGKQAA